MIVLGIDAGGTKTILSLCDGEGKVLCALERASSISFLALGEEGLREALEAETRAALREAGRPDCGPLSGQLSAVCYGAPCWGESEPGDAAIRRVCHEVFAGIPLLICNDAQVAWAGSFALRPGINILAGTGAMAFGMDARGRTARCGGWGHFFSDEGSGYWLGKQMLALFCKEADGRLRRGALYALVRERFRLDNDFELIDIIVEQYLPYRDKVAGLQRLLLEAARQGDENAVAAYRQAGAEIALNVQGVLSRLDFPGGAEVSYSGGIFHAGALVMDSFRGALEERGCTLTRPVAPPWIGALMSALQLVGGDTPEALAGLVEADFPREARELSKKDA